VVENKTEKMKTGPVTRQLLPYAGLIAICLHCCSSVVLAVEGKAAAPQKRGNPKKTHELYVKLVARPTDPSYSGNVPSQPATIFVEVLDDREDKADIGRNIENERQPPIRVIADEGDGPVEFVDKLFVRQFHDLGLKLADKSAAQRVVSVKLVRFWAEEAPDYRSTVRAAVEVTDPAGKVLWRGALAGNNKRFGRSLKPENYCETLTDATQDMINKMFGDAGFQKAISSEQ
jgi:hypothetical protein